MTEANAIKKGLRYTGDWGFDKKEMVQKADEIRKTLNISVAVVRATKIEDGIKDKGYSIYATEEYFIKKNIKIYKERMNSIPEQIRILKETYEAQKKAIYEKGCEMGQYIIDNS